jgi:hypothetical protein
MDEKCGDSEAAAGAGSGGIAAEHLRSTLAGAAPVQGGAGGGSELVFGVSTALPFVAGFAQPPARARVGVRGVAKRLGHVRQTRADMGRSVASPYTDPSLVVKLPRFQGSLGGDGSDAGSDEDVSEGADEDEDEADDLNEVWAKLGVDAPDKSIYADATAEDVAMWEGIADELTNHFEAISPYGGRGRRELGILLRVLAEPSRVRAAGERCMVVSLYLAAGRRAQAPELMDATEDQLDLSFSHSSLALSIVTRSLTRSLTHSLTYSLTHSLTHSLTRSLTHSLARSLARVLSCTRSHFIFFDALRASVKRKIKRRTARGRALSSRYAFGSTFMRAKQAPHLHRKPRMHPPTTTRPPPP